MSLPECVPNTQLIQQFSFQEMEPLGHPGFQISELSFSDSPRIAAKIGPFVRRPHAADHREPDATGLNTAVMATKIPRRRRQTDGAPTLHSCQLVTRPAHCHFERFQGLEQELALVRAHASPKGSMPASKEEVCCS